MNNITTTDTDSKRKQRLQFFCSLLEWLLQLLRSLSLQKEKSRAVSAGSLPSA